MDAEGLAEEQPGHHQGKQHKMTVVSELTVVTQVADQFSMETG
jgi:hypothetical protein